MSPKTQPRDSEGRIPSHNLDQVFAQVAAQDERIGKLEVGISSIGEKLDAVAIALTRQQAMPRYEPGKILGMIVQCAILIGSVVGGSGFVINAYSSAEIARGQIEVARQDERQKAMIWRLEYLERQRDIRTAQVQVTK